MNLVAKIPLIIVSFILSLVLWVYVQVQERPDNGVSTYIQVPVVPVNLPDGYIILNKPPSFKVLPQGAEEEIRKINPEDLTAEIDLAKAQPGTAIYPIRLRTTRNYNVTWDPKSGTAAVTVDILVQNVRKPVIIRASQQLRDPSREYVPQNTTTDPEFVYVAGPRSLVEKVKQAQAILDLRTVSNGTSILSSELELVDENGNQVTGSLLSFAPRQVQISPALTIASESKQLIVQPTFKGTPAFGYRVKRVDVTPNQIEVRGRTEALQTIGAVPTEPIDITNITRTTSVTVKPVVPGQLAVVGSPQIVVLVIIEPVPTPPTIPPSTDKRTPPRR
jgi:YbbR domain-containing protein